MIDEVRHVLATASVVSPALMGLDMLDRPSVIYMYRNKGRERQQIIPRKSLKLVSSAMAAIWGVRPRRELCRR